MTEKLLHRRQTTDNALWEIAGEEKLKNWNEENGKKKKVQLWKLSNNLIKVTGLSIEKQSIK